MTRAKTYIAAQSAATNAGADLSAQEWATSEQIISLQQSFLSEGGNLEKSIQELLSQLRLWMSDKQAVSVLTAPIFVRSSLARCDFSLNAQTVRRKRLLKHIQSFSTL